MRVLTAALALIFALLLVACGTQDSADDADSSVQQADQQSGSSERSSDLDPCSLADDETLANYFPGGVPEPETATHGPIEACTWSDANANSLTVQVAEGYALTHLDDCDTCVDLPYGDDGYAAPDMVQSTAKFVVGDMWYSVTTTGFGDGATEITDLGAVILANASS